MMRVCVIGIDSCRVKYTVNSLFKSTRRKNMYGIIYVDENL